MMIIIPRNKFLHMSMYCAFIQYIKCFIFNEHFKMQPQKFVIPCQLIEITIKIVLYTNPIFFLDILLKYTC